MSLLVLSRSGKLATTVRKLFENTQAVLGHLYPENICIVFMILAIYLSYVIQVLYPPTGINMVWHYMCKMFLHN